MDPAKIPYKYGHGTYIKNKPLRYNFVFKFIHTTSPCLSKEEGYGIVAYILVQPLFHSLLKVRFLLIAFMRHQVKPLTCLNRKMAILKILDLLPDDLNPNNNNLRLIYQESEL